jgi:Rrf2 family protein
MRLSARVDYALRAVCELAAADGPRTVDQLSTAQQIPHKYLESILGELRRGGLLRSQRGPDGGYRLARPATEISIADVIRALDGELANVRGSRPEHLDYVGAAAPLQEVWIALRASERAILETVTLAHVASRELPAAVQALIANPAAWS